MVNLGFLRKFRIRGKYEMDMCNGPVLSKVVRFAIPVMLSGVLQLLFNAVDMVVVGNFVGEGALAAVGSTGALINLIVNLFIGLSVGTNVSVARYYGAGKPQELRDTVQTSVTTSLISGGVLVIVGVLLATPLLELMSTPQDVIGDASVYMRIYFIGMPVNMFFNFGSAILRAVGDTRRPLYFLIIAGVTNVLFNLLFVLTFNLGVAGVAIATVISQAVSAVLILICLIRTDGPYRIDIKHLYIKAARLWEIAKIGLPAGFQGAIFSISNVIIQSSVNSFGRIAMAGSTAAGNIEGFVYTSMNSFHQAGISFAGQNMGAKKYDRIPKICFSCLGLVTVLGIALGGLATLFGRQLIGIYNSSPEVIEYGVLRLTLVCLPYFLCGIMDVAVGLLRGMGYSLAPTLVTLVGVCALRMVWIYTVFQANRSFETLFLSYPISWFVTGFVHVVCLLVILHRMKSRERKAAS